MTTQQLQAQATQLNAALAQLRAENQRLTTENIQLRASLAPYHARQAQQAQFEADVRQEFQRLAAHFGR